MARVATLHSRVSTQTMLHSSLKCSVLATKTRADRTNGGDSKNANHAFGLSDLEIKAVASYVAGLQ